MVALSPLPTLISCDLKRASILSPNGTTDKEFAVVLVSSPRNTEEDDCSAKDDLPLLPCTRGIELRLLLKGEDVRSSIFAAAPFTPSFFSCFCVETGIDYEAFGATEAKGALSDSDGDVVLAVFGVYVLKFARREGGQHGRLRRVLHLRCAELLREAPRSVAGGRGRTPVVPSCWRWC